MWRHGDPAAIQEGRRCLQSGVCVPPNKGVREWGQRDVEGVVGEGSSDKRGDPCFMSRVPKDKKRATQSGWGAVGESGAVFVSLRIWSLLNLCCDRCVQQAQLNCLFFPVGYSLSSENLTDCALTVAGVPDNSLAYKQRKKSRQRTTIFGVTRGYLPNLLNENQTSETQWLMDLTVCLQQTQWTVVSMQSCWCCCFADATVWPCSAAITVPGIES